MSDGNFEIYYSRTNYSMLYKIRDNRTGETVGTFDSIDNAREYVRILEGKEKQHEEVSKV